MARAIATKQNGAWVVLIDADQYGGDELSPSQARAFARHVALAAEEADTNRAKDDA